MTMTETVQKGLEGVDTTKEPRRELAVVQALHDEVKQGTAKPGQILNRLTGETAKSMIVTPVRIWNTYRALDEKKKVELETTDKTNPIFEGRVWTGKEKTAMKVLNAEVVIEGNTTETLKIIFKASSFMAGIDWVNEIREIGGAIWSHKYKLSSKNPAGTQYFVPVITEIGTNDGETAAACEKLYDTLMENLTQEEVPF